MNSADGPLAVTGVAKAGPETLQEIVPALVVAVALIVPLPASSVEVTTTVGGRLGAVAETVTVNGTDWEVPPFAFAAVTVPLNVRVAGAENGANVKVGVADVEDPSMESGRLQRHAVGLFVATADKATTPIDVSVLETCEMTGGNWTSITSEAVIELPFALDATALTT